MHRREFIKYKDSMRHALKKNKTLILQANKSTYLGCMHVCCTPSPPGPLRTPRAAHPIAAPGGAPTPATLQKEPLRLPRRLKRPPPSSAAAAEAATTKEF